MVQAMSLIERPINEPLETYAPGTRARADVKAAVQAALGTTATLASVIDGKTIETADTVSLCPPHRHQHEVGIIHKAGKENVGKAIDAALAMKSEWSSMTFDDRAAIFLRAAELLSTKHRARMNAATMVGQSKTVHQAEIDAAAELIDFLRFNVWYARQLMEQQPLSPKGLWNRLDYRPLDGFVLAITPFNFTAIAGNLPAAPALMGNTVVWKPALTQALAAHVTMDVFMEAGLPPGVINLVYGAGPEVGEVALPHPDLGGVHFTGSTAVFQHIWKTVGSNIASYRQYPRLVGETGGKDFILAHSSADVDTLSVALTRGAFEYQGQKCSAASRAYVPKSLWGELKGRLEAEIAALKVGDPADMSNFMSAVIDDRAFKKITGYIDGAKSANDANVIIGGTYDGGEGYFVHPTVIEAKDPKYTTMVEEIFGPVLSIYVYDDNQWSDTLKLVDETSPYALTGAVFARDRRVVVEAEQALRFAAGNFYINDKPTGAVVGQQPFGGGRASGTNDKAGSYLNLVRWLSARAIKETYVAPTTVAYPFMDPES